MIHLSIFLAPRKRSAQKELPLEETYSDLTECGSEQDPLRKDIKKLLKMQYIQNRQLKLFMQKQKGSIPEGVGSEDDLLKENMSTVEEIQAFSEFVKSNPKAQKQLVSALIFFFIKKFFFAARVTGNS